MQTYLPFIMLVTLGAVVLAAFVLLLIRGWHWNPAQVATRQALAETFLIIVLHPLIATLLVLALSQSGYDGHCFVLDPAQLTCTRLTYTRLQLGAFAEIVPLFRLTGLTLLMLGLMLMLRLRRRRKALSA